MAHLLGAKDLRIEYPTKVVLDGITIGVGSGDRIGVVGRNGEGKSTLIRALAGRQAPDSGEVISRNDLRVGLLDQSDLFPDHYTVEQAVVGGAALRVRAERARPRPPAGRAMSSSATTRGAWLSSR